MNKTATARTRRARRAASTALMDELDKRHWTDYFETSIEKFATAATQFAATLATHGQRLDAHDNMSKTLQDDLRDIRNQQTDNNNYLTKRIDTVQKDLQDRMDAQTTKLTDHFDKTAQKFTDDVNAVETRTETRIGYLEKRSWYVKGGIAVIGCLGVAGILRYIYVFVGTDFIKAMF